MAKRKPLSKGRATSAHQEFLSKPARRRRRVASREHRQEQARPQGTQMRAAKPVRALPHLSLARVLAGVLALGLMALGAFLFSDSRFYVTTAAIRGLHYTSAETVYRHAGIDQFSIFWIDDRETAQRIETLPYVKRATVRTALPNQVRIEIEERVPVVVWNVNGQTYWVDSEGSTMPVPAGWSATDSQAQGLPVLWDLDGSTVAAVPPGDVAASESLSGTVPASLLDAQLIASLRQVKQQVPEVTDFGYDRSNGLQFRLPGGTYVYLGKPEGMAQRVASLLVLHQSLASQGQLPAEINWRVENGYYLRLAQ